MSAANWQQLDPHFDAESEKYHQAIPSRDFILSFLEQSKKSYSVNSLSKTWQLDDTQAQALSTRLNAMEREGQVVRNKRHAFTIAPAKPEITGKVHGQAEGHGFLIPDDNSDWIYITPADMKTVFHGDRVSISLLPSNKERRQGKIKNILERGTERLVGRFAKQGAVSVVVPENKRLSHQITLSNADDFSLNFGELVLVQITTQPAKQKLPVGKVLQKLGNDDTAGIEITVALHNHNIPHEWPEAVTQEVEPLADNVLEADKANRKDYRKIPLVTIDGIDARDFDDAVYCEKRGDNYRLIVAIADVSHYVALDTALNSEARQRATSVYFPSKVIPMLPEKLSNGLCSLNPEVDRLCMVCEMTVNPQGKIIRSQFFEGVMHSHARLTYETVAQILKGDNPSLLEEYQHLVPHLQNLYGLFHAFRSARDERGAMDFDFPEPVFEFDAEGHIEAINARVRNDAHKIIEECMIAANVCAAKFLGKHKIPNLYRVHAQPSPAKLESLREYVQLLGLHLGGGDEPTTKDLQDILDQVADRPDIEAIQTRMLRSMMQAEYHPDNIGHFGLGLENYAHFTSPIRRYPDLLVHRGIRHVLRGGTAADFHYSSADMDELGNDCSFAERRADDATREAADWLKCRFMQKYIGYEFTGKVTGVTNFGLFITIGDFFIEGLLHISEVGKDYYEYDEVMQQLVGKRSQQRIKLGDEIEVLISRVDLDERQIDLLPTSASQKRSARTPYKAKTRKTTAAKNNANAEKSGKSGKSRQVISAISEPIISSVTESNADNTQATKRKKGKSSGKTHGGSTPANAPGKGTGKKKVSKAEKRKIEKRRAKKAAKKARKKNTQSQSPTNQD